MINVRALNSSFSLFPIFLFGYKIVIVHVRVICLGSSLHNKKPVRPSHGPTALFLLSHRKMEMSNYMAVARNAGYSLKARHECHMSCLLRLCRHACCVRKNILCSLRHYLLFSFINITCTSMLKKMQRSTAYDCLSLLPL